MCKLTSTCTCSRREIQILTVLFSSNLLLTLNYIWVLNKPQGVLGPEPDGTSCVSGCSDGTEVQLKLFSSFLSPDKKSWMAVSICGRKLWFIFGSTTWVMILSTPDSSMPDLGREEKQKRSGAKRSRSQRTWDEKQEYTLDRLSVHWKAHTNDGLICCISAVKWWTEYLWFLDLNSRHLKMWPLDLGN